ncbi:MAG: hypothetical protein ACFFD4_11285 [Candidatus Odinarchaeota archaeon]
MSDIIEKVPLSKFCFENEKTGREALKDVIIYYGNFHQEENDITLDGMNYEIFRREPVKIVGSVGTPIRALMKKCLSEKTVKRIKAFHPDIILYEFIGTEKFVDDQEVNPQGLFVLVFERALAAKK